MNIFLDCNLNLLITHTHVNDTFFVRTDSYSFPHRLSETRWVLSVLRIWGVRGGIRWRGMRKVDMLNRSMNTLYLRAKLLGTMYI